MSDTMRGGEGAEVCEHLQAVLAYALRDGARVEVAGQVWSRNCRVWMYVDRVLDLGALRKRFALPACVVDHVHRGTHDGAEQGLVCEEHHDAVMGRHPEVSGGVATLA